MSKLDDEIKEEIRQLALTDVNKLIELYIDAEKLKICKQRKMGLSLQQIAIAMSMPRPTIQSICKTCNE